MLNMHLRKCVERILLYVRVILCNVVNRMKREETKWTCDLMIPPRFILILEYEYVNAEI